MRIFLDTNVLVAAFATRGLCADVLRLVLVNHELVVSKIVLDELRRVLAEKIALPGAQIAHVVALLEPYLAAVESGAKTPQVPALRDASDELVVRSALAARAEVLVTGDRDLLDADLPIRVLSPRELWETLRRPSSPDEIHER